MVVVQVENLHATDIPQLLDFNHPTVEDMNCRVLSVFGGKDEFFVVIRFEDAEVALVLGQCDLLAGFQVVDGHSD